MPKKRRSKPSRNRRLSLMEFCRSLPGATEDVKWGDKLTFSVGGKLFAGFRVDDEEQVAFKCDDDDFDRLTEAGEADGSIIPAPYSARFGWVKVTRRDALPDAELRALLRKARDLVFAGLPRRVRESLTEAG